MAFRFVLLVLPALVLAKINVELSGKLKRDALNLKVYYDGDDVDVISNTERNTFNLTDNNLKNAINRHFGKRPDDAFLRSPTPWGDLYQSYGWAQVTRTLKPQNGTILNISSKPTVIHLQVFENNSTKPATFNVGISQEVQNTFSSSWSIGRELSIGEKISYVIKIAEFRRETSFCFTSSWGENTTQSQSMTVGATRSMDIVLEPGQSVVSQLHAVRRSIQIQMEYEASLSGHSAVNYADTYKDHHFWIVDIDSCMNSANLSNQIMSKEVIDIGFYTDSKLVVYDERYKVMEVAF